MERKILELFKIADELNEKQDDLYVQINYTTNDNKVLEISMRKKEDFTYNRYTISDYQKQLETGKAIEKIFGKQD